MATSINRFSWLLRSLLRQKGDIQFWDYFEPTVGPDELLLPREDDIEHTVTDYDRIDNMSQQYYGTPQMWWVIALVNDLRLCPNEMKNGRVLRIPSPAYVQSVMLVPKVS
jgi:hypothetical protein